MAARVNSPHSAVRVRARERERQAVALRVAGHSFRAIALEMGVSPTGVRKMVSRALDATANEIAEDLGRWRALEGERLDGLSAALYADALAGDRRAADLYLKYRESFRRLWGLDARPEGSGDKASAIMVIDARLPRLPDEEVVDGVIVDLAALPDVTGDAACR